MASTILLCDEDREIIIGHSINQRLLFVAFTERMQTLIRIISAPVSESPMSSELNRNPLTNPDADDLHPEYDVDYRKATPNRFAASIQQGGLLIVLDPDVAQVFTSAEAVNTILRAVIHALPGAPVLPVGTEET